MSLQFPTFNDQNTWFFAGDSSQRTVSFAIPPNIKMLQVILAGAGGSGGGGQSTAAGVAAGGGGGGGAGAVVSILIPRILVGLDVLYILLGPGGTGGAPGVSGNSGGASYIFRYPPSTTTSLLTTNYREGTIMAAGGGSGGASGSTRTGGTGGATFSATTSTYPGFAPMCIFNEYVGQTGGNGGAPNVTNVTAFFNGWQSITSPGGGGGGLATSNTPTNGASILLPSATYSTDAWPEFSNVNGGNGSTGVVADSGYTSWKPFFNMGGAGGGGVRADNSVLGKGGNGVWGCGGGGGGAGTTGGYGGNGGAGFCLIKGF